MCLPVRNTFLMKVCAGSGHESSLKLPHRCSYNKTVAEIKNNVCCDVIMYYLPGYTIIRRDCNRHGGGVAIYVSTRVSFRSLVDPCPRFFS